MLLSTVIGLPSLASEAVTLIKAFEPNCTSESSIFNKCCESSCCAVLPKISLSLLIFASALVDDASPPKKTASELIFATPPKYTFVDEIFARALVDDASPPKYTFDDDIFAKVPIFAVNVLPAGVSIESKLPLLSVAPKYRESDLILAKFVNKT